MLKTKSFSCSAISLQELKFAVLQEWKIPFAHQRFIFDGKSVSDDDSIPDGAEVFSCPYLQGGKHNHLFLLYQPPRQIDRRHSVH